VAKKRCGPGGCGLDAVGKNQKQGSNMARKVKAPNPNPKRAGLGSTVGTLAGATLGGLAGIPGGPAGMAAGAGIGAGIGSSVGNYFQNRVNTPKAADNVDNPVMPQEAGANPVMFPGSQNSPAVTSRNLGDEGNALFFNRYDPEQNQLMYLLGQLGLRGLTENDFNFAPIENQARTNFAQNTIPSIAERFSGLGAQRSSAFGQALGQAGAGLESDLASQKQLYNLQRQGLLQNLAALGLYPKFESLFSPAQPSFLQSLATNAAGPAAQAAIGVGGQYLLDRYGRPATNPAAVANPTNTANQANTMVNPATTQNVNPSMVPPMNAIRPQNNAQFTLGKNGMPLNPAVQNTLNQLGR
jgi:hypothetical protein